MGDTERERGRDTGRGRSRLHARSPTWDLIRDSLLDSIPGLNPRTPGSGPGLKVAPNL